MQQVVFELNVDGAHPVKGAVCRCASASFRPPLRLEREQGRTTFRQARAYLGKPCPICSGEAKPLPTVTPKADALLAKAKASVEAHKTAQRKKYQDLAKFADNIIWDDPKACEEQLPGKKKGLAAFDEFVEDGAKYSPADLLAKAKAGVEKRKAEQAKLYQGDKFKEFKGLKILTLKQLLDWDAKQKKKPDDPI